VVVLSRTDASDSPRGSLVLDNSELLALFEDYVRAVSNLAPATQECYLERVAFLQQVSERTGQPIQRLTEVDLRRYISQLVVRGELSKATINGRLRVFKVFYSWCHNWGYREDHPAEPIKVLPGENLPTEILTKKDILTLFRSFPPDSFHGIRGRALILIFYDSMLRVGELLRLTAEDINWHQRRLYIRHTKSHRPRVVPFSDRTARALRLWMALRGHLPGDRVFCGSTGVPLSYHGLMSLLKRKQHRLGIHLYAHIFRHTGATHYLETPGASLASLSEILGHSDPRFTYQRYVHLTGTALSRQHETCSPVSQLAW